jgi:D-alanyl-D-alanine dipeptidase
VNGRLKERSIQQDAFLVQYFYMNIGKSTMRKLIKIIEKIFYIIIEKIYPSFIPRFFPISREIINSIEIIENNEPLMLIAESDTIKLRTGDGAKWLVPKLRRTVLEKLIGASELLPTGYCFVVMSAYIPISLQQEVWNRKYEKLKTNNPEWSEEKILSEVPKYAARPVKGSPHNTGGSVDVIILDNNGRELDMGSEFGGVGKKNHTHYLFLTLRQKRNRKLLYDVMIRVGFLNTNPFEWWHFAYGDRAWAAYGGFKHAIYDGIEE